RMDPIEALSERDGVARIATLRRVGVTEHALRLAVRSGRVFSVRRGWVALCGADAMLVAAARRGVVLSCVTLGEKGPVGARRHRATPRGTVPFRARLDLSRRDSLESADLSARPGFLRGHAGECS